ncbi:hypothetical protein K437DRAFT_157948 [Tilletiaria anomala UBC 951]|uniref:Amine oxidase domain-containing protein n=1 Tax=Tilletiaria anomala (strain ATCC 24038 / CBS 436.72 / UBC 951) TaxID=1037660 RepID=A0A066VLW1_TILAU|nr:uncharacterized protein K437DRAFT_157948 [Tilletiaria anomala UBC 951]KDN42732.1 hypothetical protein K437DRAFT_157948 [Tilletiaria anomala UBC 951]
MLMLFFGPPVAEAIENITPERDAELTSHVHTRLVAAILPKPPENHRKTGNDAVAPSAAAAAIGSAESSAPSRPVASVVTRWRSDPHSLGSYTYLPAARKRSGANGSGDGHGDEGGVRPAASPLDMMELARPVCGGQLGFCGEACHPDLYASVHGALMSGLEEGVRIVNLANERGVRHLVASSERTEQQLAREGDRACRQLM